MQCRPARTCSKVLSRFPLRTERDTVSLFFIYKVLTRTLVKPACGLVCRAASARAKLIAAQTRAKTSWNPLWYAPSRSARTVSSMPLQSAPAHALRQEQVESKQGRLLERIAVTHGSHPSVALIRQLHRSARAENEASWTGVHARQTSGMQGHARSCNDKDVLLRVYVCTEP